MTEPRTDPFVERPESTSPGAGLRAGSPHSSDYISGADWRISLSELLRLIDLFSSTPVHAYWPDANAEDGFRSGAAVKAAGFDYDSIRRQHKEYTKEELLAIMREHYEKGLPLDLSSFREIRGASVFGIIRKRFGTYEHAITELGLDYTKIRKDALSRAFKGVVFEKYVAEAFKILRPELRYQKSSTFEGKRSRPDFRNDMIKLWVDAKIDSWSGGVGLTARNYLKHCKRLEIIYLTGNPRVWIDDSVEFIPIADYYDQLKEIGREDFVRDFEKLRKGIFRPELQSELERFVKREIKNVS